MSSGCTDKEFKSTNSAWIGDTHLEAYCNGGGCHNEVLNKNNGESIVEIYLNPVLTVSEIHQCKLFASII